MCISAPLWTVLPRPPFLPLPPLLLATFLLHLKSCSLGGVIVILQGNLIHLFLVDLSDESQRPHSRIAIRRGSSVTLSLPPAAEKCKVQGDQGQRHQECDQDDQDYCGRLGQAESRSFLVFLLLLAKARQGNGRGS